MLDFRACLLSPSRSSRVNAAVIFPSGKCPRRKSRTLASAPLERPLFGLTCETPQYRLTFELYMVTLKCQLEHGWEKFQGFAMTKVSDQPGR
jgi:hypothetical protein